MSEVMLDRLGRPRAAIMDPAYRLGRPPANAGQKYPAEVYTGDEMLRLLAACTNGKYGTRNKAAIVVMWRAGLRIAETLALEPRDLDLTSGSITVRHGKGNQRRMVGLDERGCEVVGEWLAMRAGLMTRPWQGAVFCTVREGEMGFAVQQNSLREGIHALGHKARIAKRVHPHGFRHTFAMELLREGVPVPLIQKLLGHGDLITTAHYLDHLAPLEAVDRVRGREWPKRA